MPPMTRTNDRTRHRHSAAHLEQVRAQLAHAGRSAPATEDMIALDADFFRWHRTIIKGELPAQLMAELAVEMDRGQFQSLTAILRIQSGIGRESPQPATIGLLADELKIDPSGASRIASDLIGAGYVRREAAQDDGRKSILTLTDKAARIFEDFRSLKWAKLIELFAEWSDQDIADFARLFGRYVESQQRVYHLDSAAQPTREQGAGAPLSPSQDAPAPDRAD